MTEYTVIVAFGARFTLGWVAGEPPGLLAKHYGFTEEELVHINYDIKYRIGDELTRRRRSRSLLK